MVRVFDTASWKSAELGRDGEAEHFIRSFGCHHAIITWRAGSVQDRPSISGQDFLLPANLLSSDRGEVLSSL